ncbi:hypothetical protein V8E55_011846 [Tylopilus felleus]
MYSQKNIGLSSYSQSKVHMVMYYYACCLEVAGKWFRASPLEGWLADWNKGLKIDMMIFSGLLGMYATRQSSLPIIPACYMAFGIATDAASLSVALRQIPAESFNMIGRLPTLLSGWCPSSKVQPFGFKSPWWFEDCPGYQVSTFPPSEITQEADNASTYFKVTPLNYMEVELNRIDMCESWVILEKPMTG